MSISERKRAIEGATQAPLMKLTIEKLSSEGKGIARAEGKVYFIPSAVPGDVIEAEVKKDFGNYAEAGISQITQKSPDRIDPPCIYFPLCGGCQLQHINYDSQLLFKKQVVEDALSKIARVTIPVPDVLPSPKQWNYRTRMTFHQAKDGKVGLYKALSHDVVEVKECRIADERINGWITEGLAAAKGKGTKDLDVRADDAEGFVQANEEQNKNLVLKVIEFLDPQPDEVIFDLYSGSGNYSLPVSKRAKEVVAIELNRDSIREGERNQKQAGVANIRWRQGGVLKVLRQLKNQERGCAKMIVNPPRTGLMEDIEGIFGFEPKKIVYVSCHPATFARDVAKFMKHGYVLEKVQPIDMFPQTVHVEVVGKLQRS